MKNGFDRRLFLRGAGAALIGLPLLEEFAPKKAFAQDNGGVPRRVLTLSFGLGIETKLQNEGVNGPLQPLMKYADRMAHFTNLNNDHLAGGGGTPHFRVGATQFVGRPQRSFSQAGGPSIEQIVKNRLHPNGVPTVTGLPSVSSGIWSRTGATAQYTRHWNEDGSAGEAPRRRPSDVFERIFSNFPRESDAENVAAEGLALLEQRKQQSILDAAKEQYQFLLGDRSYLGKASKDRIDNHLQTIRQVETRLVETDRVGGILEAAECALPDDVTDPGGINFYDAPSGPTGGPEVTWEDAQAAFRGIADVMALGISCDAVRFGSMIFYGAGGHLDFQGTYEAAEIGASVRFSGGSPHDNIFHDYDEGSVRAYQHYSISQMVYMLDLLDAIQEPNGKSALDNTLVVIGTEYGKNHVGEGIFHAVLGGEGRFRPGKYDDEHGFEDLYETLMQGYGISDSNIDGNLISELLV